MRNLEFGSATDMDRFFCVSYLKILILVILWTEMSNDLYDHLNNVCVITLQTC